MDKVIVTVLLIIGGVITSLAIFNGLYPAINRSSTAIISATTKVSDRIESRIEIIQVADNGTANVEFWVKNVGTIDIDSVDYSDIFFGPEDDFYRVTYGGAINPYWDYQLEGGKTDWKPTVTNRITVHMDSALSSGTYLIKMIIPNGISARTTFSVE